MMMVVVMVVVVMVMSPREAVGMDGSGLQVGLGDGESAGRRGGGGGHREQSGGRRRCVALGPARLVHAQHPGVSLGAGRARGALSGARVGGAGALG